MSFKHTLENINLEDEYPKLVRDKIPEIIKRNEGIDVATRNLASDDEYLSFLLHKVAEEAEELSRAKTDANLKEEIADVYEVIAAIQQLKGISESEISNIQDEKRKARGAFGKRILLLTKPEHKQP